MWKGIYIDDFLVSACGQREKVKRDIVLAVVDLDAIVNIEIRAQLAPD